LAVIGTRRLQKCDLTETDAPIIDCEPTAAFVDDVSVFVCCEVRARPPLTSIYWLIDDNNTVVMDGESVGDYWSMDMVRSTVHRTVSHNSERGRNDFSGRLKMQDCS